MQQSTSKCCGLKQLQFHGSFRHAHQQFRQGSARWFFWPHSHILVLWWVWLEGWAQRGLLTRASICHHSNMVASWSSGFLHSGLGLPESVSKQEVEDATPLKPGMRNRHSITSAMSHCMFRNVWPSLICHTTTLRKTSTFLADQQDLHDSALDGLISLSAHPISSSSHVGLFLIPQTHLALASHLRNFTCATPSA